MTVGNDKADFIKKTFCSVNFLANFCIGYFLQSAFKSLIAFKICIKEYLNQFPG